LQGSDAAIDAARPIKTAEQQAALTVHRTRDPLSDSGFPAKAGVGYGETCKTKELELKFGIEKNSQQRQLRSRRPEAHRAEVKLIDGNRD
jgi:hypothetical protein